MCDCRIQLLGRLQFERGHHIHTRFRTQKTASLLAYLALHPGPQPRELLAGLLWPDDAPEAGRHSLRMALSSLRRQLERSQGSSEPIFESNRFAVGLRSETFSTDVGDFDAAVRGAHRASDEEARAHWLSQAVSLYGGPFLPGFYEDWCVTEAARLQGAFEDAVTFLVTWHYGRGESEVARDYERRAATLGVSLPSTSPTHEKPKHSPVSSASARELGAPNDSEVQPATLATLLAFDGIQMTAELQDGLVAHGGTRLSVSEEMSAGLWAFSGATSALRGAATLRHRNDASLRFALYTGETQIVSTSASANSIGLRGRAVGLLASAQPSQMLCCETTMLLLRDQAEIEGHDLGTFHLAGMRVGSAPARVFQLTWRDEPQETREFEPLRAVKARGAFIPQPLGRFFGRETEMAALRDLLSRERLVTLSGAGGAGKTRLALQVALDMESRSDKAIFWVPLADVTSASAVADAILDAMRVVRHNSLSAFDTVLQELNHSSQSVLLLLDNFEHLVEGGAAVIESLLEKSAFLQCLTTSRRVLGVGGEVEMALFPLRVPPSGSLPDTPQSLEDQPSVHLFCDRARLVRPDFALTPHNAPSIAELCRHLEGIPLALELAAARVGSLSPARILERLQALDDESGGTPAFDRLDFLQTASRTAPSRHRTLRTALDWSFEALSPQLQAFFSRLWVFRGGCSVEAASEVGEVHDALDALEELRVRSLLFLQQGEEEPRFRMLETVRQYALERAHERGEVEATRQRHATHVLKWAQTEAPYGVAPDAAARLQSWARVKAEADNLRTALSWATQHNPEMALQLALACHNFTGVHFSEREVNVERALESIEAQHSSGQEMADPAIVRKALGLAATHAANRGDVAKQTKFARRRLELAREASKPEDRGWALFDWGCACRSSGHFAESRDALLQSRRIFEEEQDALRRFQLLGWTLVELGITAFVAGELETAKADFSECEHAFTGSGDRDGQASAKSLFADVLFHQGDFERARQIWPDVVRIERELGDERDHPWRRHQEGKLAVALGELERGHQLLQQGLRAFWLDGQKLGAVRSLLGLSSYWLMRHRPEHAIHLLRVEKSARTKAGWPRHEGWEPLRESIWRAACHATSISPDTIRPDEDLPDLASVIENELNS